MAQYLKFLRQFRDLKFFRPFQEAALVSESVGQWAKGTVADLRSWHFALKDIHELNELFVLALQEQSHNRQSSAHEAKLYTNVFLLHHMRQNKRNFELAHDRLLSSFCKYKSLHKKFTLSKLLDGVPKLQDVSEVLKACASQKKQHNKIDNLIKSVRDDLEVDKNKKMNQNFSLISEHLLNLTSESHLFILKENAESLAANAENHVKSLERIERVVDNNTQIFKLSSFSPWGLVKSAALLFKTGSD